MAYNYEYPYTDPNRFNVDWLLKAMKDLRIEMDEFVNLNTIRFHDPIEWNITTQYEKLEVVTNGGYAYLSKKPVPVGVPINNTDYWQNIGQFGIDADTIRKSIAESNEGYNLVANRDYAVGDLLWFHGDLCKAILPITTGASLVLNTNIEKVSIEEVIKAEILARTNADSVLDSKIDAEAQTREEEDIKRMTYIPVTLYNIIGDGSDVTSAVQDLIDTTSANGGGTLYFPKGEYLFSDSLHMKSKVSIKGDGDCTIFNFPDMPLSASGSGRKALDFMYEQTETVTTGNTTVNGECYITVADSTLFEVGDLIEIYSLTQRYNYKSVGDGALQGELAVVENINGNVLRLDHGHYGGITNPYVRKVNACEGVTIEDIKLVGRNSPAYNQHAVYIRYGRNININRVSTRGFDWYSIGVVQSYNVNVTNNNIVGCYYDGTVGTTYYGVAVMSDSCHVTVQGNYATRERHLYVNSAYTLDTYYGQPSDIVVDSNIADGMMIGGGGISYAYEHHGAGNYVVISNNIANGCYSGANIEGSNVKVIGNYFTQCARAGVIIGGGAYSIANIEVSNNTIHELTLQEQTSGFFAGIYFDTTASDGSCQNVNVFNNNVRYSNNCYGVRINNYNFFGIVIKGNTFYKTGNAENTCMYIATTNTSKHYRIVVVDNTIIRGYNGIQILAPCIVKGNTILASNDGIILNGSTASIIDGNVIYNCTKGLSSGGNYTITALTNNVYEGTRDSGFLATVDQNNNAI